MKIRLRHFAVGLIVSVWYTGVAAFFTLVMVGFWSWVFRGHT